MPVVYPTGAPVPVAVLGWDGTDFRVILVDAGHRQVVRGEDQLFSLKGVLADTRAGVVSGVDGFLESNPVPAGEYWIVTNVVAKDVNTALTAIRMMETHDGVSYRFGIITQAIAANEEIAWGGHVYLDVDDTIRVYFTGSLATDNCVVWATGYRMTVEV